LIVSGCASQPGESTLPHSHNHRALQSFCRSNVDRVHLESGFRLFIGNGCTRRAGKVNNLKSFEANFAAPFSKIRSRIIESITEFDQHVQRHQKALDVLAARIVNQSFDGYECAAGRERIVGRADEVHFLFQIPVVKNHPHGDHIGLRQRIFKEISGSGTDSISRNSNHSAILAEPPVCSPLKSPGVIRT